MSLFPTVPSAGDFAPLFRLLDDYDAHRSSRGHVSSLRSFTPRFDVRESDDAYHLDGELPGISQENIDIEFSDRRTLVISGCSEREFHNTTINDTPPQSHDVQGESGDIVRPGEQSVTKSANNKHRYLVSERSLGEFHRTFSFPDEVDQDKVKASLKNGILSVVVPKVTASGSKKITIE
ncbi:Hsp20/alpha crystallin family protein [Aspergillus chevalieri]|uniref:Heat shock protein n=1 Tax=Aspergillus chevalieri TaxID=182096 RepID=A0A7R7ZRJ1_ASPCH|nr:heat shock protein [Aspergillus chevalieri]BCR92135.1 heat shock protein [Aspergillus chevalieri]